MKKVLSLLAFAMIMLGISACGSGASGSPKEAAEAYLSAMKSGDVKAIVAACCDANGNPLELTAEEEEQIKEAEAFFSLLSDMEYTVGDAQIDGDKAEVPVTMTVLGHETSEDLNCIKGPDGKWRVNGGL